MSGTMSTAQAIETLCDVWNHEYGSDHRDALQYRITIAEPEARLLFKHASWKGVREYVQAGLQDLPPASDIETFHNRLISLVERAIKKHTPRAKPSPYAKRWWTKDLTDLRKDYTYWRNSARTVRRVGQRDLQLERRGGQRKGLYEYEKH